MAVAAPSALADTTESANWAGYAVHRSGTNFRQVSASWRQPTATCTPGQPSYSAIWIGLGGFNESSQALEQTGLEVNCDPSGRVVSSAWYELVPAASQTVQLTVRPGDLIAASVGVVGHTVRLKLVNETTHRSFSKTLVASLVDVSSADWIVEAPSLCQTEATCQTLPLANFGTTGFRGAKAVTTTGHAGSISDRSWSATKINLITGGRRFVSYGSQGLAGVAVASPLIAGGTAFSVSYSQVPVTSNPVYGRRGAVQAGHLVHPVR
jgi:hypothetical protein